MPAPNDLVARVHDFALKAFQFYVALPEAPKFQIPGKQFYRAATSVEANYRAAKRGRSRAEFIAKLGIVAEEADEATTCLRKVNRHRTP